MSKTTQNLAHFGNTGDLIASLPSIKQFYIGTGIKPTVLLVKDHPAEYYEGAVHPVKNDLGENVSLNQYMIDMVIPLLKEQDYIEDVRCYDGQEKVDVNLSFIRDTFCNIPFGDIRRWYFYVYPNLACDLSEQYIHVPNTDKNIAKGKTIIARTERYTNELIDYSFLKDYQDDLLFAGTMKEYNLFCMNHDLQIEKLHVNNFLELSQALVQSNGLISNQTMIFQIAEGLKIPRAVELCHYAPNVIPCGKNGYDFYAQVALELYFKQIHNKKPAK